MASAGQESVTFELRREGQRANPAAAIMPGDPGGSVQRRSVLFLVACVAGLIPWTVGLAVTLPHRYVVGTWTLTWTGFVMAVIAARLLRANAQAAQAATPSQPAPSLWRAPLPAAEDRAGGSDTRPRNSWAYWLTNQ
jgi:hypothetical protein